MAYSYLQSHVSRAKSLRDESESGPYKVDFSDPYGTAKEVLSLFDTGVALLSPVSSAMQNMAVSSAQEYISQEMLLAIDEPSKTLDDCCVYALIDYFYRSLKPERQDHFLRTANGRNLVDNLQRVSLHHVYMSGVKEFAKKNIELAGYIAELSNESYKFTSNEISRNSLLETENLQAVPADIDMWFSAVMSDRISLRDEFLSKRHSLLSNKIAKYDDDFALYSKNYDIVSRRDLPTAKDITILSSNSKGLDEEVTFYSTLGGYDDKISSRAKLQQGITSRLTQYEIYKNNIGRVVNFEKLLDVNIEKKMLDSKNPLGALGSMIANVKQERSNLSSLRVNPYLKAVISPLDEATLKYYRTSAQVVADLAVAVSQKFNEVTNKYESLPFYKKPFGYFAYDTQSNELISSLERLEDFSDKIPKSL
ncbi:MAG: hypothetical protein ACI83O_000673 [Patescibacteria group bacterium]|jgi:hypothetical protein